VTAPTPTHTLGDTGGLVVTDDGRRVLVFDRHGHRLHECRPVAVIDRKLGLSCYGGGAVVPLNQVRFARRFQIGSSSPQLVALTPGGTTVLKRGNPFDGGAGNVDEIMTAVVYS
jgi:hypothetical protein